jgi:hypothetical protein
MPLNKMKNLILLSIFCFFITNVNALEQNNYKCENSAFHIPKGEHLKAFSWEIRQEARMTKYFYISRQLYSLPRVEFHYCGSVPHGHLNKLTPENDLNGTFGQNEEWFTIEPVLDQLNCTGEWYAKYITFTNLVFFDKSNEVESHVQIELKYEDEEQKNLLLDWVRSLKFIPAPSDATSIFKNENNLQF